jgi:FkbH-like protein
MDSILFVDDNYGELTEVVNQFPQIHCLLAQHPAETEQALRLFPNLWHWKKDETDKLRIQDLELDYKRQHLMQKSQNMLEYMKFLEIKVQFFYKPYEQCFRLHELSIKTNQFNTGLLRLSEQDIELYLNSPEYHVISFRLQDKLSDSGIVGVVFGYVHDNILTIEEIWVVLRG